VINPLDVATPGGPLPFQNTVSPLACRRCTRPQVNLCSLPVNPTDNVAPKHPVRRGAVRTGFGSTTASGQIHPYPVAGMAQDFRNGYIETYTADWSTILAR